MRTIELGRSGARVSQLALGCMLMGTVTDETAATAMLDRYAEAGGTFLDTANCYGWWYRRDSPGGESEELLGRWLARTGRRDDVFLATKGGGMVPDRTHAWGPDGEPAWDRVRFEGAGAATLRTALDASLRRLRTDHVDLYYVHVDDLATPLEETLAALAGFVQAGKVRHLGWSNVRTWRLERLRQLCAGHGWPAPVAVQQQHSYLRPKAGLDADARLAVLADVALEVGAAPNQVVLAWLLRAVSPSVVPLVGPRTAEQLDAALAALDVKLTDDQVARLDAAGA